MKPVIAFLVILVGLIAAIPSQAADAEWTVDYFFYRTPNPALPNWLQNGIPERYGVWVSVYSEAPAVAAFTIVLHYESADGLVASRTQTIAVHWCWTHALFWVGKAKVKRVEVTALAGIATKSHQVGKELPERVW